MFCCIYAIIAIKHDFVIHLHSQGPSGRLKTSGFALSFQHVPRDLANVNEWKIMFDPSIILDDSHTITFITELKNIKGAGQHQHRHTKHLTDMQHCNGR